MKVLCIFEHATPALEGSARNEVQKGIDDAGPRKVQNCVKESEEKMVHYLSAEEKVCRHKKDEAKQDDFRVYRLEPFEREE